MDSFVPLTGLEELDQHLDGLLAATAATAEAGSVRAARPHLDARLFDNVELQLTDANIPALAPRLLPKIVAVLQQQPLWPAGPAGENDSAADMLSSMATKLLGPVRFADVFALASEDDLVAALSADAAPATNVLAMTVVHKAVEAAAAGTAGQDLDRLAGMTALLTAFLTCWLAAPAVEVGEKGGRVLGDLLDVDCPLPPPSSTAPARRNEAESHPILVNGTGTRTITVEEPMGGGGGVLPTLRRSAGPGGLWQRLFRDGLLLGLLTQLCGSSVSSSSSSSASSSSTATAQLGQGHRARLQRTIAQGRVLRVLPRLASLNLAALASSSSSSSASLSSSSFSSPSPPNSVLNFVALHMVDRSDRLMHLSLVDFFETLVSVMRVAVLSASSSSSTNNAPYAVEVLRSLLREATASDGLLANALLSLPDRTVPEEADALRQWLGQLMPSAAPRVAGWQ